MMNRFEMDSRASNDTSAPLAPVQHAVANCASLKRRRVSRAALSILSMPLLFVCLGAPAAEQNATRTNSYEARTSEVLSAGVVERSGQPTGQNVHGDAVAPAGKVQSDSNRYNALAASFLAAGVKPDPKVKSAPCKQVENPQREGVKNFGNFAPSVVCAEPDANR